MGLRRPPASERSEAQSHFPRSIASFARPDNLALCLLIPLKHRSRVPIEHSWNPSLRCSSRSGAVPVLAGRSRNRLDAAVPSASRTPPPPAAPARALAAPGGEADATLLELEARRGPRIEASFLVAILGIDASLVPRRGDLSTTGIYFEVAEPIGEVDMIQWLRIASTDRAQEIGLMAHVVRAVTLAGPGEVPPTEWRLSSCPRARRPPDSFRVCGPRVHAERGPHHREAPPLGPLLAAAPITLRRAERRGKAERPGDDD